MAIYTVIGAGMMGSAWCFPIVDAGHTVRLVGSPLDRDIVATLQRDGHHLKLGLNLPEGISYFDDTALDEACDGADALGLGVSSAGVDWACSVLPQVRRGEQPVAMITKGLRFADNRVHFFPDVIDAALAAGPAATGAASSAAIAGPCIAGELARRVPTCVVACCRNETWLGELSEQLKTDYYHVSKSVDVVGVETCAALKNAYAMGIAFGVGLAEREGLTPGSIAMHNIESAVFAQASSEMGVVVKKLGGELETVLGMAGVGDMDVTNNGGRTGRFGRLLGLGFSQKQAVVRMKGATLECLEILAVMEDALAGAPESELRREELPLLSHLIDVGLHGAPVDVPMARFGRP